jgi:hypothetical protein
MMFDSSIVIERASTAGSYDPATGKYVLGTTALITIQASVQPANERDLMTLPEGNRAEERIKVYSDIILFTDDEISQKQADVVQFQGKRYKVEKIRDYSNSPVLPHYRADAVMIQPAGG